MIQNFLKTQLSVSIAAALCAAYPAAAAETLDFDGLKLIADTYYGVNAHENLKDLNISRSYEFGDFSLTDKSAWSLYHADGDEQHRSQLVIHGGTLSATVTGPSSVPKNAKQRQASLISVGKDGWVRLDGDSVNLTLNSAAEPATRKSINAALAVGTNRLPQEEVGKDKPHHQQLTIQAKSAVVRTLGSNDGLGGSVSALLADNNSDIDVKGDYLKLVAETYARNAPQSDMTKPSFIASAATLRNGSQMTVKPKTKLVLNAQGLAGGKLDGSGHIDTAQERLTWNAETIGLNVEGANACIYSQDAEITSQAYGRAVGIRTMPTLLNQWLPEMASADIGPDPMVLVSGKSTVIRVDSHQDHVVGIYAGNPYKNDPDNKNNRPSGDVHVDPSHPNFKGATEQFLNFAAYGDTLEIRVNKTSDFTHENSKAKAFGIYAEDGTMVFLSSRNTIIDAQYAFGGTGEVIVTGNLDIRSSKLSHDRLNLIIDGGTMRLNTSPGGSAGNIGDMNRLEITNGAFVEVTDIDIDHNSGGILVDDGAILRVTNRFNRTNANVPASDPNPSVASDFTIETGGTLEMTVASAKQFQTDGSGIVLKKGALLRVTGWNESEVLSDVDLNKLRSKLFNGLDQDVTKSAGIIDFGNAKLGSIDLSKHHFTVTQSELAGYTDVQTDELKQTTVTDASGTIAGSYAKVVRAEGGKGLVVSGTLKLNASSEGGALVTDNDGSLAALAVKNGVLVLGEQTAPEDEGVSTAAVSGISGELGSVSVSEGGLVSVAGRTQDSYTIEQIDASDGGLRVAGATLKVTEDSTVHDLAVQQNGTLDMSGKKLTMSADSDKKEAEAVIAGTLKAKEINGSGVLFIGSASSAGTVEVEALSHTGVIFLDPAWTGTEDWGSGSWLIVNSSGSTETISSNVVIGMNSNVVIGTTKENAVEQARNTGRSYGYGETEATLYIAKPTVIDSGACILMDGSLSESNVPADVDLTQGTLTLRGSAMAMFDVSGSDGTPLLTADSIILNPDARIGVMNANAASGPVTLFEADSLTIADNEDGIDLGSLLVSNDLMVELFPEFTSDGQLVIRTESHTDASTRFPGLKAAELMNALYRSGTNNVNAPDKATALLSRTAAFADYGLRSKESAVALTNQMSELAVTSGVYNAALDAGRLVNRTIERRTSVVESSPDAGLQLWVDVGGTTNRAKTLYGSTGYDLDLAGTVFGADIDVMPTMRFGAAVSLGKGTAHARNAPVRTKNDVDFAGITVYGAFRLNDFNLRGDIGWIHAKSEIKGANAYELNFDEDVGTNAVTLGFSGEYSIAAGPLNLVPHAGLRWTRLSVDGFEGGFATDADTMNIVTVPLGISMSGTIGAAGWKLMPVFDLSVVPSIGTKKASSVIRYGGVSENIRTQIVDTAPIQMSLGLDTVTGAWTIGSEWNLGVGSHDRLDNALTLKARYAF